MASFVWKNITYDRASKELVKTRRAYLKCQDNDGYKRVFAELEKLEEMIFQSVFIRVKGVVSITEQNFERSMKLHLAEDKNQKKLQHIEE